MLPITHEIIPFIPSNYDDKMVKNANYIMYWLPNPESATLHIYRLATTVIFAAFIAKSNVLKVFRRCRDLVYNSLVYVQLNCGSFFHIINILSSQYTWLNYMR